MSRTESIGHRTKKTSRTSVLNKDPNFDYCFKRKEEVESGEASQEDWSPVSGKDTEETWENSYEKGKRARTKGTGQLVLQDTILCRRTKDASAHFKKFEDDKYNNQMKFVRDVAKNAKAKLRGVANVKDSSKFSQKTGPTEDR